MKENQPDIFCTIGSVLTSSLNPKEVFRRVMGIIGDYFAPANWSLLLMEEETERLRFEIVMGVDANKLKQQYIEKGEGIVGWVCQTGEAVVVEDARNDPRFSRRIDEHLGFTTRSAVCVPLLNGNNRVIGAIELINKIVPPSVKFNSRAGATEVIPSEETFTQSDMMLLMAIGTFTGIAAENAFLHQKVKELSMIDSLTGINNRHYFNEMLQCETERMKRYNHSICMIMIDVDDFKIVNDTYGHLTGDKVLRTIADILRSSVRGADILARFGGDEFVILMPVADENAGRIVADRIQRLIQEWNSKKLIKDLQIGLSIGVYASDEKDLENILSKADQELYLNKNYRKSPEELTSEDQMRSFLWKKFQSENDDFDNSGQPRN